LTFGLFSVTPGKSISYSMSKPYRLTAPDGSTFETATPGELGGNRRDKLYGRLDCWSANLALPKGYAKHCVFFRDEEAALPAGYRPCGHCLKPHHQVWKADGEPGKEAYPWLRSPKEPGFQGRSAKRE
jgi:hypothetical protein